eukprot:gene10829-3450_t
MRPGYSKIYMDLVSLSNDENVFKKLGLKLSDRFSEEAQKKYSKIFGEKLDYKSYGSLTNINIFGISFVIKCQKKLFLFTADCHSRDIVEGLDKYFKDEKKFFYVDAPHHGSKKNDFKLLLDHCEEIENLVVSSNHKLRPSKDFLDVLKDDQKAKSPKIKKIYFNYKTEQSKKFVADLKQNSIDTSNIVQNTSNFFDVK